MAALGLMTKAGSATAIQSGSGIAGGGSVEANGGPAEFSVFGAHFQLESGEAPLLAGSLSYLDVTGKMTIASTSITAFGAVEGAEATTRQVSGIATVNGEGAYPFDLVVSDGGAIGTGLDVFQLAVGADGATEVTEATYEIQSNVQSGNLQLIDFVFDSADVSGDASPTPAG